MCFFALSSDSVGSSTDTSGVLLVVVKMRIQAVGSKAATDSSANLQAEDLSEGFAGRGSMNTTVKGHSDT